MRRADAPGFARVMAYLMAACLTLGACRRGGDEVVLYSSVDGPLLTQIVSAFEQESGISVRVVGDTEATKSTGLIERLLAEKGRPRCDVFWSSENLGVMQLSGAGVLAELPVPAPSGWPRELVDPGKRWIGLAQRARVLVYNTHRVPEKDAPRRLRDLVDPRFKGRVVMADPRFGTTRVHLAAALAAAGPEATRAWLAAMRENGVRLLSGNSAVVKAIALGEADVGVTDTDDVYAGQANGWPVAQVFEEPDVTAPSTGLPSFGALVLPNSVGMVRGGPHPDAARRLIEFIVSARCEEMLARSESRNIPARADLASRLGLEITHPWRPEPGALAGALDASSRLAGEVLGR